MAEGAGHDFFPGLPHVLRAHVQHGGVLPGEGGFRVLAGGAGAHAHAHVWTKESGQLVHEPGHSLRKLVRQGGRHDHGLNLVADGHELFRVLHVDAQHAPGDALGQAAGLEEMLAGVGRDREAARGWQAGAVGHLAKVGGLAAHFVGQFGRKRAHGQGQFALLDALSVRQILEDGDAQALGGVEEPRIFAAGKGVQVLGEVVDQADEVLGQGQHVVQGEGLVFVQQVLKLGEQLQRPVVLDEQAPEILVFALYRAIVPDLSLLFPAAEEHVQKLEHSVLQCLKRKTPCIHSHSIGSPGETQGRLALSGLSRSMAGLPPVGKIPPAPPGRGFSVSRRCGGIAGQGQTG